MATRDGLQAIAYQELGWNAKNDANIRLVADAVDVVGAAVNATVTSRKVTASTSLTAAEFTSNNSVVEYESASAGTVAIPLDSTTTPTGTTTGVEVSQTGTGQASIIPAVGTVAAQSPLQRLILPNGAKARAQGSSIFIRRRAAKDITVPARPTTGLRALLVGDSITGGASSLVASWPETSGSALALPAVAQATTLSQGSVDISANGHKGVAFDGSNTFYTLTGSWLDLFRNRATAMAFVTYRINSGATGDRALFSFLNNVTGFAYRVSMLARDTTNGTMMISGRRLDADANTTTNAGTTGLPDFCTMGARWLWSTAQFGAYKNNVTPLGLVTLSTAGNTSDTSSFAAAIGSSPTGGSQKFWGTIYEIAVYDDNDTVRNSYQAFAQAQYGSEYVITGDTTV